MTIEQAKQASPVHLKGVITYCDFDEPDLFIQDSSGGIWINLEVVKPNVPLSAGDLLEIQGVTETPDFAPQVGNLPLVTRRTLHEEKPSFRILLAEDNAVNQVLAVRLLEKRGYSVVVAANGRAAVETLEKENFHLVPMDIQMPGMDGFEATAAIREKEKGTGKRIPIVAMTAHALKGDQDRYMAAGMDGYVSKPIRSMDLFAVIDRLLVSKPVVNSVV
jgi:two-component system sensor histidine kinase/response regulator